MRMNLLAYVVLLLWLPACTGPVSVPTLPVEVTATTAVPEKTETKPPDPTSTSTPPTEPSLLVPTATLSAWPPLRESSWLQAPWPTAEWSRSSPEAQGIDSEELFTILDSLNNESSYFDSILLIRNGYLVLEAYWSPYDAGRRHVLNSATKSILSALVGITYKDGLFQDVNQPIIDLFLDLDLTRLEDGVSDIRIKDVLTMSAGMNWLGISTQDILEGIPFASPGIYFRYENSAPQLMANAVQEMTGMDPLDFANQRLFAPLGISEKDVVWKTRGVGNLRSGANGLEFRPEDMAKIGYLYLNEGMWDGEQFLPKEWVEKSTFPNQFEIDSAPVHGPADGYGYYWWVNTAGGYFAAMGYGGQLIVVFPGKDLVLITTGDSRLSSGKFQFNALTNYIVPLEMAAAPLPDNPAAEKALQTLIAEFGGSG